MFSNFKEKFKCKNRCPADGLNKYLIKENSQECSRCQQHIKKNEHYLKCAGCNERACGDCIYEAILGD